MKEKINKIKIKKSDPENVRMKFGKHAGKRISDLPTSYLKWISENWNEDTKEGKVICHLADIEYQFRLKHGE